MNQQISVFYSVLKVLVRFASKLYFRHVAVSGLTNIPSHGPVLLVANHPNSFLDAVLLAAQFNRPMYFLARGDAFNNRWLNKIFRSLYMLPIYRLSEGKENLTKNGATFDAVQLALENGYIVLVFGEGISENNWRFRVQKKGAPRIAQRAWNSTSLSSKTLVIPVGITYDHYDGAGKQVLLQIGTAFTHQQLKATLFSASFINEFNAHIVSETKKLAYFNEDLRPNTPAHVAFRAWWKELHQKNIHPIVPSLHSPPQNIAAQQNQLPKVGLWLYPLYTLAYGVASRTAKRTIFFDSITFGVFALLLPFYLILFIYLVLKLVFYFS